MIWKFDALPEQQKRLWPELVNVSKLGCVLYGGTAAALRFGHRTSIDFDFFSSEKFSEEKLFSLFPWLKNCIKTQNSENSYSYITDFNAKITFLGNFAIGRIGCPDMDTDTGIQIASAEDIFALKLRAAHDRVAIKDFIDIAEFIRQGYSLEKAILGAQTLIQGMPPAQFTLQMLTWYDHPEFAEFSQLNRDILKEACNNINLDRVTEATIGLTSSTLYDEALYQIYIQEHPELFGKDS